MNLKPHECRVCGTAIEPFMSFGRMPVANGFLSADALANEYFYDLAPSFCSCCGMFQIIDQPAPEKLFNDNYAFYSGTSRRMQAHFAQFADEVINDFLVGRPDPLVVELGSNDGIMLRHFKDRGFRHLGVEPSANVAAVARAAEVSTMVAFFDSALADRIARDRGQADVVLAANVMCHIPDIRSVAEGIRRLLKPDGVLVFEDPYLGDMVAKTAYDQIYDEHVFIFSALSVARAFGAHGLELIDVVPQSTHGGSMRYVLAPNGRRPVSATVRQVINQERAMQLDRLETYLRFKASCETSRERLMATLEAKRNAGKRVVGYGATSKSTTVTNYCGITNAHVEYICDTTPIKQGKLSPGAHLPVKPHADFASDYPDFALLFAWNHAAEIQEKETRFTENGGRWIVYVPEVNVVS